MEHQDQVRYEGSILIMALVPSPAIDVVGIGFILGEISVHDISADERLMRMFMEGGGVKALGNWDSVILTRRDASVTCVAFYLSR